jgi:HNH endonuclease
MYTLERVRSSDEDADMQRYCEFDGCDRVHYARGLCNLHWQRQRAGRRLDAPVRLVAVTVRFCRVERCDRVAIARGYCSPHYRRVLARGDPEAHDPIGKHWRPDPRAGRPIGRRFPNSDGYIRVWDPEHPNAAADGWVLEHRRVMAGLLGRPLYDDELVHHRDGDRSNNDPENLELCLRRQPPGQRVADLLPWATSIIQRYGNGGLPLRLAATQDGQTASRCAPSLDNH